MAVSASIGSGASGAVRWRLTLRLCRASCNWMYFYVNKPVLAARDGAVDQDIQTVQGGRASCPVGQAVGGGVGRCYLTSS